MQLKEIFNNNNYNNRLAITKQKFIHVFEVSLLMIMLIMTLMYEAKGNLLLVVLLLMNVN